MRPARKDELITVREFGPDIDKEHMITFIARFRLSHEVLMGGFMHRLPSEQIYELVIGFLEDVNTQLQLATKSSGRDRAKALGWGLGLFIGLVETAFTHKDFIYEGDIARRKIFALLGNTTKYIKKLHHNQSPKKLEARILRITRKHQSTITDEGKEVIRYLKEELNR